MTYPHESLAGFPAVTTLPLLWGDQDAFGHVNNIVYLRWCETARVEYLARVGLSAALHETGVGPIVARISCDYKRPLNYPDTVRIGTRITRIGNSSLTMEHRVVSQCLDALAATVESILVVFDYTAGKPVPVPAEVREAIAKLEGHAVGA